MRFAISDSLISGQPLYLLYSYSNCGPPGFALLMAIFAVQETGSVRLQVTGSPPTTRGSRFTAWSAEQPYMLNGSAAAIAPCKTRRRPRRFAFTWISLAGWPGPVTECAAAYRTKA